MISKRALLTIGGGGALAFLLSGSGQAATSLRFVTPARFSLSDAAVFYAKAAGFFKREGLDVDFVKGAGANGAQQRVVASQADIARTGGAGYIVSRVNVNAPLISIATIAQTSSFFMVLPPGSAISLQDLKGKMIGVDSPGGAMENALILTLRAADIDPHSVNRVKVPDVPASYDLILAKKIDGFMASISVMTYVRKANPNAIVYSVDDGLPGRIYIASPTAIKTDEEKYIGFLRAVHRSASAILDEPDPRAILTAISFIVDISEIKEMDVAGLDLKQNAQTWVASGPENLLRNVPEQWAAATQAMAQAQMINRPVDPTTLYSNALLDKALRTGQ